MNPHGLFIINSEKNQAAARSQQRKVSRSETGREDRHSNYFINPFMRFRQGNKRTKKEFLPAVRSVVGMLSTAHAL